jgi:hypothetical protein
MIKTLNANFIDFDVLILKKMEFQKSAVIPILHGEICVFLGSLRAQCVQMLHDQMSLVHVNIDSKMHTSNSDSNHKAITVDFKIVYLRAFRFAQLLCRAKQPFLKQRKYQKEQKNN